MTGDLVEEYKEFLRINYPEKDFIGLATGTYESHLIYCIKYLTDRAALQKRLESSRDETKRIRLEHANENRSKNYHASNVVKFREQNGQFVLGDNSHISMGELFRLPPSPRFSPFGENNSHISPLTNDQYSSPVPSPVSSPVPSPVPKDTLDQSIKIPPVPQSPPASYISPLLQQINQIKQKNRETLPKPEPG